MSTKENRLKIPTPALKSNSAPEKKLVSRVSNGKQDKVMSKRHQSLPPLGRNKDPIPTRIPLSPQKQSNSSKDIVTFFVKLDKKILIEVPKSLENKENGQEKTKRDSKDDTKPTLKIKATAQNGSSKTQTTDERKESKKEKLHQRSRERGPQISSEKGQKKADEKGSQKSQKVGDNSQSKVTEFFSIRRSERRTAEEYAAIVKKRIEMILAQDNDSGLGLNVSNIPGKGRGVITTHKICKGDFVIEYAGDLMKMSEAKTRECEYAMDLTKGCYMYYFKFNDKQYCLDGTEETGRLGRLINHSRLTPNLYTKVVDYHGEPRLIFIAKRDINIDEELLYDYGDRDKKSLEAHPWLAL